MRHVRFTASLAWLALVVAAVAGLLLLSAGPGYRMGWWELGTAFALFRWAAWGGMAGAAAGVLALLAGVRWPARGAVARAILAVLVGAVAVGFPWYWLSKARSVPPIHDITTDTSDPPEFRAILPLREDAPNSAEYGGDEIAAQQEAAYPDLETLSFRAPPREVFGAALDAANAMGWEIVASNAEAGRIEAVATTTWFGFKDDVVVRVRDDQGGTAVDVRSVSRVGRSDVGANAERIRAFRAELESRLEDAG